MKKISLLFIMTLLPLMASAYDAYVDGIYYILKTETKQAAVTFGDTKYTGSIVIPATVNYNDVVYDVISIGEKAFYDCSELTSVTIPNGVIYIGNWAFEKCSGLTSIEIPNSVTIIAGAVFRGCSNLKSVNIPDNITGIPVETFHSCTSLTSVTIPDNVTAIGERAFQNCSSLTSITIPNNVTSIGIYAFSGCSSMMSVTIGSGVTSIAKGAFNNCSSMTAVHITDIAAWCNINFSSQGANPLSCAHHLFMDGREINDLVIPSSVTSIGELAFYFCDGLTSVNIPNSVTTIGPQAFASCSGLTSITIPNSVNIIESTAFNNCSGLTSIIVDGGNSKFDSRNNCNAIIETSTNTLITGCKNTIIPNGVSSIGMNAFASCSGLTSIVIPTSVTSIGQDAFNGCSSLSSITIPNRVTTIGDFAFLGCSRLNSVTIGKSVTNIGTQAFYITGLKEVYCYAKSIPTTGYDCFYSSFLNRAVLYVPEASGSDYQSKAPWSRFGSIVAIGGEPLVEGIEINETNFPDENFRNWILSQEYGQDGVLTDDEIADVTSIALYGMNVQSLQGIEYFTALQKLDCHGNQLTSLDVSKNTALVFLLCEVNQLKSLNVSGCTALQMLSCAGNKLTSLDVSECTALDALLCNGNQLTSIDVSKNIALNELNCCNNLLTSLDVSNNTALNDLSCHQNQISGKAMDEFVESLPTVEEGRMYVIDDCKTVWKWDDIEGCIYDEKQKQDDKNVMTVAQVNAAKEKGWQPYYKLYRFIDLDDEEDIIDLGWKEYAGSEPTLRGDVNGDGVVNGTDIQAIINLIVEGQFDEKADVNEDGNVNGTDIQEVINIIVNAE